MKLAGKIVLWIALAAWTAFILSTLDSDGWRRFETTVIVAAAGWLLWTHLSMRLDQEKRERDAQYRDLKQATETIRSRISELMKVANRIDRGLSPPSDDWS